MSRSPVTGLLLAVLAGYGAFLAYTAAALGWRGLGAGPRPAARRALRPRLSDWLARAGLEDARMVEVASVAALLAVLAAAVTYSLFGGLVPALLAAVAAAVSPATTARARVRRRREEAREAWPRMIEEIRLLTGSLGRSIPQALLEVGRRSPTEMHPAFAAAQREWLISTDFARTLSVLKLRLADATADAVCETLLVAHQVGGADLERRLHALAEDRIADVQGRKDGHARQAGARFARRFVVLVPLGMALAGLSIGNGRDAYRTAEGQLAVVIGLAVMAGCWMWAGRIMRFPEPERVLR